jgi:hypothetical protein
MRLRDKITSFFDAAKELALEISSPWDTTARWEMMQGTFMIPVLVEIGKPGDTTILITPKERAYIIAARSFMDAKLVHVMSIKQTKAYDTEDPAYVGLNRGADAGFDIAFWSTDDDCCPFDFGEADPDHPIQMVVRPVDGVTFPLTVNMVVFAKPTRRR